MTDERISTPRGWTEADYDSDHPDVRQAKQPAIFEHESGDLGVFVRPDEPGAARETTEWRVEIGEGGRENLVDADTIELGISDRASAIERARDVMETIAEEGVPASPGEVDWAARLR